MPFGHSSIVVELVKGNRVVSDLTSETVCEDGPLSTVRVIARQAVRVSSTRELVRNGLAEFCPCNMFDTR